MLFLLSAAGCVGEEIKAINVIQLLVPHAIVCPQSTETTSGAPLALSVSREEAKEQKDQKAGEEEGTK